MFAMGERKEAWPLTGEHSGTAAVHFGFFRVKRRDAEHYECLRKKKEGSSTGELLGVGGKCPLRKGSARVK